MDHFEKTRRFWSMNKFSGCHSTVVTSLNESTSLNTVLVFLLLTHLRKAPAVDSLYSKFWILQTATSIRRPSLREFTSELLIAPSKIPFSKTQLDICFGKLKRFAQPWFKSKPRWRSLISYLYFAKLTRKHLVLWILWVFWVFFQWLFLYLLNISQLFLKRFFKKSGRTS